MKSAPNIPRGEHPRPQWLRQSWQSLNGTWDFAFDFGVSGEARGMAAGGEYPLKITVPFCPESRLSGIGHTDFIPAVWYRRTITVDDPGKGRTILHFGAVDYLTKIWVNGQLCGTHKGGYTAFEVDITKALRPGENTLVVYAEDDLRSGRQPFGKQCHLYHSAGCSYTRTTGIWQSVWMEFVPDKYLADAKMTPHAADGAVEISVRLSESSGGDILKLTAFYNGKAVGSTQATFTGTRAAARLAVDEIHLWDVGKPELYDLTLELIDRASGETLDRVSSYFALRDIAFDRKGLTINGKPVFMRLILDQGFNPEGIYTAPTAEFLKKDIELTMALGFNGARFHQRVFEDLSLYYADSLGYLVWVEQGSGIPMGSAQAIEDFLPEWLEIVKQHYNHPCVIGWCPLNETYHEMALDPETHRILYRVTKELDDYRPVIDASGGVHYDTDMFDVHDYEQDPAKLAADLERMKEEPDYFHSPIPRYRGKAPIRIEEYKGQPYWVSEYGGTFWNPAVQGGWGYGDAPRSEEEFAARYEGLTHVLLSHPRICGFCYAQLTDIEQEQNGLYFYDRSRKFADQVYDRIRKANLETAFIEE